MVLVDCLANVSTLLVLLLAFPQRVWGQPELCRAITWVRVLVATLNRSNVQHTSGAYYHLLLLHKSYYESICVSICLRSIPASPDVVC